MGSLVEATRSQMTTIALIVVGGHLSLHQTLERGGTDFAILAKAICQSFDLGQMLGQSLTVARHPSKMALWLPCIAALIKLRSRRGPSWSCRRRAVLFVDPAHHDPER